MLRLEDLPGRVFVDTCVVNFILDYGAEIYENEAPPDNIDDRTFRDIQALRSVFFVGERAHWQWAISPHTWQGVNQTRDPRRRHNLESWLRDIWQYWCDIIDQDDDLPTFIEAERLRVRLLSSGCLNVFPDLSDRVLICDAVAYRCELFLHARFVDSPEASAGRWKSTAWHRFVGGMVGASRAVRAVVRMRDS